HRSPFPWFHPARLASFIGACGAFAFAGELPLGTVTRGIVAADAAASIFAGLVEADRLLVQPPTTTTASTARAVSRPKWYLIAFSFARLRRRNVPKVSGNCHTIRCM